MSSGYDSILISELIESELSDSHTAIKRMKAPRLKLSRSTRRFLEECLNRPALDLNPDLAPYHMVRTNNKGLLQHIATSEHKNRSIFSFVFAKVRG